MPYFPQIQDCNTQAYLCIFFNPKTIKTKNGAVSTINIFVAMQTEPTNSSNQKGKHG